MDRVALRIPKQQIKEIDQQVEAGKYPNRSEAIRSAVRQMLDDTGKTEESSTRESKTWARV